MRQIKNTILTMLVVLAVVSQVMSQACILTAPANITVNNSPGVCGANVTLASAVAGQVCTSVVFESALSTQNFNSGALPAGWLAQTDNTCSLFSYTYGPTTTPPGWFSTIPANMGATGFVATIDDDGAGLGCSPADAWFESPVAGEAPLAGKQYQLKFGYNFFAGGATFRVDVWNGSAWVTKFSTSSNGSGVLTFDVTPQMNPGFKVRFYHDDNGFWGYGLQIDNYELNKLTSVPPVIANSYNAGGANASGSYPVGTTTVTYTVVGSNPAITAVQNITVVDNEKPVLDCPADATYSLKPGECAQLVTYEVSATDNCPVAGPLTQLTVPQVGSNAFNGITFDIRNDGTSPIKITGFFAPVSNGTHPTAVYVTTTATTAVGNQSNAGAWTLLASPTVTGNGGFPTWSTMTYINAGAGFTLAPGQSKGFYVAVTDGGEFGYMNGNFTTTDGSCTVISNGHGGGQYPFVNLNNPRAFFGRVEYQTFVPNPTPNQTAGLPSGSEFPIGTTTNIYTAVDGAGNTASCTFGVTVQEYPFATTALACNDLVNISLGEDCQVVVGADMILEGGPYGCYDDYIVSITGGNNPITSPGTYGVTVTDPETGNSCWGNIVAEDKLPPVISCGDFAVTCIDPIPAVAIPPFNGSKLPMVASPIAFEGGTGGVTVTYEIPAYVTGTVTDLDVFMDIQDDWLGDLVITLTAPDGTTSQLLPANGCGNTPDIFAVIDDEGAAITFCNEFQSGANVQVPGFLPAPPLSTMDGKPLAGIWTVNVDDVFNDAGIDGFVNQIELRFAGASAPGFFPQGPCGEDYVWTYNDNVEEQGCYGDIIYRTWTASDVANNKTTCYQTITVSNIGLGDILLPPSLVEIENCGAGVSPEDIAAYFDVDSPGSGGVGAFKDDYAQTPGVVELHEGYAYAYPHYLALGYDGKFHVQKVDNNVCSIYATYTDQVLNACGIGCLGNSKVIRTWTLLDWCTLETATYVQIIKAVDKKAPTFIVKDVTVSVNPWGCVANFAAPMPWELQDNCDASPEWWLEGPAGVVITPDGKGGYNVTGAPKTGEEPHHFVYKAIDCCGNISTAIANVTVIDRSAPVAVAKQNIVISLTGSGTGSDGAAKLYAWMVDNGSYDHCSGVKLEIRRPADAQGAEAPSCGNIGIDGHNNNSTFNNDASSSPQQKWAHPFDNANDTDNGEYVKFCCEDLGGTISAVHQVILRVWDNGNMNATIGDNLIIDGMQDNYNETWADIRVENKLPPVIVCPDDVTITCDMELNLSTSWKSVEGVNLTMTGGPAIAYDLCNGVEVEYKDTPSWTNTCENVGKIRREFRAIKGEGATAVTVNCYQTITVSALPSTFKVTPPSNKVEDAECDFTADDIKDGDKPKSRRSPM
ncbi:MAG: HYR domain-containing protein [Saprospiraceae bacterium]|nr:HYR domain-containing protein [Saprospiraceae bacterium]